MPELFRHAKLVLYAVGEKHCLLACELAVLRGDLSCVAAGDQSVYHPEAAENVQIRAKATDSANTANGCVANDLL
jgi:hypothetical protein